MVDNAVLVGGNSPAQPLGNRAHLNEFLLQGKMADISTASAVYLTSPYAGTVDKVMSVIDGAITGGDAVLSASINTVLMTGGTITIANATSAAGDVDSCAPTAANVVAAGDTISVATDGGSTNTVSAQIVLKCTRTA
jgi:hypothetical protein